MVQGTPTTLHLPNCFIIESLELHCCNFSSNFSVEKDAVDMGCFMTILFFLKLVFSKPKSLAFIFSQEKELRNLSTLPPETCFPC